MYSLPHYGVTEAATETTLPPLEEETDYVGYLEQYGPILGKLFGDSAEEDYERAKVDLAAAERDCAAGRNSWLEPLGLGPCGKATKLQARVRALKAQADYDRMNRYFGIAFKSIGLVAFLGISTALILRLTRKD